MIESKDRVLDKTIVTDDEQYQPAVAVAEVIEEALAKVLVDTYNTRYIVRVTVDRAPD